jgi:hypothetical protein
MNSLYKRNFSGEFGTDSIYESDNVLFKHKDWIGAAFSKYGIYDGG